MALIKEEYFAALTSSGMPKIPQEFSVVPIAQIVPSETLAEIKDFIELFDRVTTRATWQKFATKSAPEIARLERREVCFFSAWDFHLSPEGGWHLIECNDNGSGFLFAALINRLFYELSDFAPDHTVEEPVSLDAFTDQLSTFIEREIKEFFASPLDGLVLILDTSDTLRSGKFYREFILLRDLLRSHGWCSVIGTPADLRWDGNNLRSAGQPVVFIINRSTDFFWEAEEFAPLRAAYRKAKVYVAPNPFTYATRERQAPTRISLLAELGSRAWDSSPRARHPQCTYTGDLSLTRGKPRRDRFGQGCFLLQTGAWLCQSWGAPQFQDGQKAFAPITKERQRLCRTENCDEASADFRKQRRKGASLGRSSCVGVPG